jgi:hypothetical protein
MASLPPSAQGADVPLPMLASSTPHDRPFEQVRDLSASASRDTDLALPRRLGDLGQSPRSAVRAPRDEHAGGAVRRELRL